MPNTSPWVNQCSILQIEWHSNLCLREREREIHYVHSASLAYEDGIVFMSEPSTARQ